MGITVVPPDVNSADIDFTVADNKIYFGLSAIKGCGGSASEAIVRARRTGGPFTDIFDFCERVDPQGCNRSTIETLIKAGAMDAFGARRAQLMAVIDKAMQAGASALADHKRGQGNLFDDFAEEEEKSSGPTKQPLPDVPEFPDTQRLAMEKEVLGMYLSSHPLAQYADQFRAFVTHTSATIKNCKDRQEVIVGGMISSIKLANTRNPKPGAPSKYANFDLEDLDGNSRCICWPDGYATMGEMIEAERIVLLRAAVDKRGEGDEYNLIANEIIPIETAASRFTAGLRILLSESQHSMETLPRLNEVLRGYPGKLEVHFALQVRSGETVHLKTKRHRVDVTPELRARLDDLLGEGNHRLIMAPPNLKSAPPPQRRFAKQS
ncbi:MAG: OB-fold nucleic acid binding domain-containing protein [Pirellulales bacterium]